MTTRSAPPTSRPGTRSTRSSRRAPDKALFGAGTTGWVAPIPIVKQGNEWRFDVEAGKKEMQARLIGRNELAVIQTLLAIVDAQRDYAASDPMKVGLPVYARRLLSSPGRMDGLYWESKPGEPESPLGPLVAKAQPGEIQQHGYYGYRFRLLYSQGRRRRAAPTTTWSTAACWAASPSSPGRCAGARPA